MSQHTEGILKDLAPPLKSAGLQIVKRLRAAGHQAVFAGGVVRDLLLGRNVSDIDIATSARPEEVEALFERTISVGRQFGVVVVLMGEQSFEVATFRREGPYLDGRRPSRVEFTEMEEDALRRDFTVNALFLDPESEQIIDFVGGRKDLQDEVLKTVGDPDERFAEDQLRVLRAIRFSSQLGFRIHPSTWAAVRAFSARLAHVSWERIRDELIRMLTGPSPADALRKLQQSGILSSVLPEVEAMVGVEQPPEFHPEGDVFVHTCLMFELATPRSLDPPLALGVLLHDVGKPPTFSVTDRIRFNRHAEIGAGMAAEICQRLKLSNDWTEEVVELVRDHLRFINIFEMRESTLKRFLRRPIFEKHLELHRLDCLASHGDLRAYEFCRNKLEEFSQEQIRPRPILGGQDLIDAGLTPGPLFSVLLGELEDEQLEGRICDREAALNWLDRRLQTL